MLLARSTTSFQASPGNVNDHSAIQLIRGVIAPVMTNVCGSCYSITMILTGRHKQGTGIGGKEAACAVFR